MHNPPLFSLFLYSQSIAEKVLQFGNQALGYGVTFQKKIFTYLLSIKQRALESLYHTHCTTDYHKSGWWEQTEWIRECRADSCTNIWTATFYLGTRWCSWLRHCVVSRKVASSIPDGDNRIFHWLNLSGSDSASNTGEHQRRLLGGKSGRCVSLTTLPPSCASCLRILRASNSWSPKGLSRPIEDRFNFTFINKS